MEQKPLENWKYVVRRDHKFGLRVPVPKDVKQLVGKGPITKTLGTGDPIEGKLRYYEVLQGIQAKFDAARRQLQNTEPTPLSVETAQALVRDYYREIVRENEQQAHAAINAYDLPQDVKEEHCQELIANAETDLQMWRADGPDGLFWHADKVLMASKFPTKAVEQLYKRRGARKSLRLVPDVDRDSDGYRALLLACYEANIEILERVLAILRGKPFDATDSLFGSNRFPQNIELTTAFAQTTPQASHRPNGIGGFDPISLNDLLGKYFAALPNMSDRTKLDMEVAYRPLVELKGGHTDANVLTKQDFRDALGFIRRMPTQIGNNKKKWAGMSLAQIVEATEQEDGFEDGLLSARTVNKYMGRISKVMRWAEDEPLIQRNNAKGISVSADEIDDDETKRQPFAAQQLNALFQTSEFTNPDPARPSLYWAVLIGLFQGMRCEEILQLKRPDVQEDETGALVFDIHKRDGNHLKNKSSARRIPLNPRLYDFGIDSLFAKAAKVEDQSLFPDLKRGTEGKYTPAFSRHFSRYLAKHGLKEDGLSFHSLRHSFRDETRVHSLPEDRVCALGGWSLGSDVHASYGTRGLQMPLKIEAIKQIAYTDIDFSHIEVIDWNT